jgi:hypothetical protein
MKWIRRLFWIAVFVGVLVFGWQFAHDHDTPVVIQLPGLAPLELTLWLALVLAVGLGAALSLLATTYQVARLKLLSRRYRKLIKGLEAEVHQLRNLPLSDAEAPSIPAESSGGSEEMAERALGRGA